MKVSSIYFVVMNVLLLVAPELLHSQSNHNQSQKSPNIIIILADDVAYGDLSCYGNTLTETPNLDQLAKEGMRFTDFYSNSCVCSPTRAALLTGRYQQRTGVPNVSPKSIIKSDETLIASRLKKEKGYSTGIFGKWHLSGHYKEPDFYRTYGPNDFGFEEFTGCMDGMIDHTNHLTPRGRPDWWMNNELVNEEGYDSHLIANHAIRFIHKNKDRPFFAYVSFTAIHFPWTHPHDEGHYKWYNDHTKAGNPISSKAGPYDGTPELQRALLHMLTDMDVQVGRIMKHLKELGLDENTLVFFTSDNGGYLNYYNNGARNHYLSNMGGLRGQKHLLYEGGIRVPAIARMPGKIPEGTITEKAAMTFDLYPTILELAGLEVEKNPKKIDGISIWPMLTKKDNFPERMLFWEYDGDVAVRQGEWKLIKNRKKDSNYELYNLKEDKGEKNNQVKHHPTLVNELKQALKSWTSELGITRHSL